MGAMAKSPAHERAVEMLLAGDFPRYEEDVIQWTPLNRTGNRYQAAANAAPSDIRFTPPSS